ncbi:MAG: hypothetical protein FJ009_05875 [Chloroflexi bacterium]|nr:hypothetical protein [Chloroflexota bacterium]
MIDESGQKIFPENMAERKYKKRFSFSYVNIPIGSELTFTRDQSKKAIVVSDSEVEYQGERYSLTKLAFKLLREQGYDWKTVQGPAFFEHDGKTLFEIKKEQETDDGDSDEEE